MDDDNLRMALKHIRDCVAEIIRPGLPPGQADGDNQIKWEYEQIRTEGRKHMVQVEIFELYEIQ